MADCTIDFMAKSKKTDRHLHKILALRLPEPYRIVLARSARKNRRTLTEEAKIAFETYFGQQGLWPPADEEQDGE